MLSRRCALALVATATLLTGCGGSHGADVLSPIDFSGHAHPAHGGGWSGLANPATTCTVYESGYATQIIFDSQQVDVRPACGAWTRIRNEAGVGYLWSSRPQRSIVGVGASVICELSDRQGIVTVRVVEDTGFTPVSGRERNRAATACARMRTAGWVRTLVRRG